MKLFTLIFAAVPVLVQSYARKYEAEDFQATLAELHGEFSMPLPSKHMTSSWVIRERGRYCRAVEYVQ